MNKNLIVSITAIYTALLGEVAAETWDCGKVTGTVFCQLSENGTFTVSGSGEMKDYSYTEDPNYSIGTYPASTAPWGDGDRINMQKIKNIVVEEGVTRIGNNAFLGAENVTNVSAIGVNSIGENAFYDTYRLIEINIPEVETIEASAFKFAVNLKNIEMPNIKNIGNYALYNTSKLEYAELSDTVSLGSGVFINSKLNGCTGGLCTNCQNKYVMLGKGCVVDCSANFKAINGFCYKIRYTMQEANELTSNDNENMIEWIFE